MTSSSDLVLERCLDTMILVYALLEGHPASSVCQQFILKRSGWSTTTLNILESYAVLAKVYGVDREGINQKLNQLLNAPIVILPVDILTLQEALKVLHTLASASPSALRLDLTDSVVVAASLVKGIGCISTEDANLVRACQYLGIQTETPFSEEIRKQVSDWEEKYLPQKGLPRVLKQVYRWLREQNEEIASAFWSQTGNGSHLP